MSQRSRDSSPHGRDADTGAMYALTGNSVETCARTTGDTDDAEVAPTYQDDEPSEEALSLVPEGNEHAIRSKVTADDLYAAADAQHRLGVAMLHDVMTTSRSLAPTGSSQEGKRLTDAITVDSEWSVVNDMDGMRNASTDTTLDGSDSAPYHVPSGKDSHRFTAVTLMLHLGSKHTKRGRKRPHEGQPYKAVAVLPEATGRKAIHKTHAPEQGPLYSDDDAKPAPRKRNN